MGNEIRKRKNREVRLKQKQAMSSRKKMNNTRFRRDRASERLGRSKYFNLSVNIKEGKLLRTILLKDVIRCKLPGGSDWG